MKKHEIVELIKSFELSFTKIDNSLSVREFLTKLCDLLTSRFIIMESYDQEANYQDQITRM